MPGKLIELFEDKKVVEKIKEKLPYLFQLAELESSRAGKIGMEVGSVRERIIVALLIYKFGEENVESEIPITKPEVDVRLFDTNISVKTTTGNLDGVKLIWTVDALKAKEFRENYTPHYDLLIVQINWNKTGSFYYIPTDVQNRLFKKIGRKNYIKLPKPGTNPRGVEITKKALTTLVNNSESHRIPISWKKKEIDHNPYTRWVDLWEEKING